MALHILNLSEKYAPCRTTLWFWVDHMQWHQEKPTVQTTKSVGLTSESKFMRYSVDKSISGCRNCLVKRSLGAPQAETSIRGLPVMEGSNSSFRRVVLKWSTSGPRCTMWNRFVMTTGLSGRSWIRVLRPVLPIPRLSLGKILLGTGAT